MVERYLADRQVLRGVVVLIDARRGAETEESDLFEWLAEIGIPALPVLTKADKLAKSKRKPAAFAVQRTLGLPRPPLLFAAPTGDGVDDLWRLITKVAGRPRAA
jgi:GTP-binding protein